MKIQLSDHFNYKRLLKFVLPSILMMLFTSIYGVVDGVFVSNYVGSNALSSINIVMPLIIIVGAFGFMLGAGGSAEVARALGEGKKRQANKYFTVLILTIITTGIVLSTVCIIFIRPISYFLGASELLIDNCVIYGRIILFGTTFFMLQTSFQAFFVVAEKPKMGLALALASGFTNMILDYLFVYVFNWQIAGAAIATVIGYIVGGVIPLIYFYFPNSSILKFVKTKFYYNMLIRSCANGSSEMVSNISMSIVTFLYNLQLMKFAGENGVAAITVIMYINFIFIAILIGFSIGTAPIIGYNYGAENHKELKNMFRMGIIIILITSFNMTIISQIIAEPAVSIFVGRGNALAEMTVNGFRIYSISFLICGINIFGSSFFTALCNGKISAAISFLRSLLLPAIMTFLLPYMFGFNGIWWAINVSEALTVIATIGFFVAQKEQYKYI